MKRRAALNAFLTAALLSPLLARAGEPHAPGPPAVDADFLEFLGSLDSEGDGWGEFLGNTDLDKHAPAPPSRKPPAAAVPAAPVKPPSKGADK